MFTWYSIKPGRKIQENYADWHVLEFCRLLHSLFHLLLWVVKSRKMRWARHVVRMWEGRGAYNILVGRPERRKLLWRPRHRWEKNIKMNLHAEGWWGRDWFAVAEDEDRWRALVEAAINLRIALNAGNFLSIWELVSFSGRTLLRRDIYSICYICDVGVSTAVLARVSTFCTTGDKLFSRKGAYILQATLSKLICRYSWKFCGAVVLVILKITPKACVGENLFPWRSKLWSVNMSSLMISYTAK